MSSNPRSESPGAFDYVGEQSKGRLPPVKGLWSLTMYSQHHFCEPNAIKRFSIGTKNKDLKVGDQIDITYTRALVTAIERAK